MTALPANARTWTTRDRSAWRPGPWDDEPDKVSWTDPATGRPCLIHRGPSGALCGYVAVDPGHPLHGAGYDDADGTGVEVHGGLTYADRCQDTDSEASGICHVPEPGAPEDVWWFGFDCAHAGDLAPRYADEDLQFSGRPDVYRTVDYVVGEVERLARHLAGAA